MGKITFLSFIKYLRKRRTLFLFLLSSMMIFSTNLMINNKDIKEAKAATDITDTYWYMVDNPTGVNSSLTINLNFVTTNHDGTNYTQIVTNNGSPKTISFVTSSGTSTTIYTSTNGYVSNVYRYIKIKSGSNNTDSTTSRNLKKVASLEDRSTITDLTGYTITLSNSISVGSLTVGTTYSCIIECNGYHFRGLAYVNLGTSRAINLTNCIEKSGTQYRIATGQNTSTFTTDSKYRVLTIHECNNSTLFTFLKNGSSVSVYPHHGITKRKYMLFTTSVAQENHALGTNFYLNGTSYNTAGTNRNTDNLYITLTTTGGDTVRVSNCFFKTPITSYSNKNVYAFELPGYETNVYSSLTIHLWNGGYTQSFVNYFLNTYNITLDITYYFDYNVIHIDASVPKIVEYSRLDEGGLMNAYGSYFLRKCPCSGDGNATDEQKVRNAWNMIANEGYFSDSHLPSAIKTEFRTFDPFGYDSLSEALTRYDYIVFYKYGLEDFLNRRAYYGQYYRSNKTFPKVINVKEDASTIIIIIASSFCILSITSLSVLLIIKKKHQGG